MGVMFESLGFEHEYDCEVAPEFPGSGVWDVPVYGFARDRDGGGVSLTDESFASRWGTPLIVRVEPFAAQSWVGWFEAGGLGGKTCAVGTPNPTSLCAVNVGAAYLVRVDAPQTFTRLLEATAIKGARRIGSPGNLVLWDDLTVISVGRSGLSFQSPRLCLDGLEVVGEAPGEILCEADVLEGGRERFSVDAATGLPIDRPPFDWSHYVRRT